MYLLIAFVVIVVGVYFFVRRRKNARQTNTTKKLPILAVERNGVIVAYRREDLPAHNTGMLAPTTGIMVFADVRVPGPTTGKRQDLHQLATQTGREVLWESPYAMHVPYTGGFCTSPEQDATDYGMLVLPKASALARLQQ